MARSLHTARPVASNQAQAEGSGARAGVLEWLRRNGWAALTLLAPLACFLVMNVFLSRWAFEIGASVDEITDNALPDVLNLSAIERDVRLIERRATLADPASRDEDRAAIGALQRAFARAEAAHLATKDFTGEREAYLALKEQQRRFYAAVDEVLGEVGDGRTASRAAGARLHAAADATAAAAEEIIRINADQVVLEAKNITEVRTRLLRLNDARDALAFLFVVVGTWLGVRASHREAALAEVRRRLDQEHVAELDAFAGRVAHDLRDHLGGILARASLGERAETLEQATSALGRVADLSKRMAGIIDALLGFARAGARPDPDARCEIGAVVRDVVADYERRATAACAAIVARPMPPREVRCEAAVLAVILANLVGNALKYIGDGHDSARKVELRAHEEGAEVYFEVEDTGPGLPPGTEARVFEPLFQLPDPRRGKEGIGLGLATVKRLVEAHGGAVGVVSRPGFGSVFWFTLPKLPP